jgi:beta-glucanase (GH16 family)
VASPDPTPTDPCNPDEPAGYATSAAAAFGWGKPTRVQDFNGSLDKSWGLYDGPGHMGKGKRTPSAVSIKDGVMTVTGDSQGNTEGMAWNPGQKYGRWEGRVKAPVGDRSYHALMLLWPDAENWPVGGEVDFMEMSSPTRQSTDLFLHYGKSNSQLQGTVKIDATQWHNWAVEWTPTHITAFLDGKQWWTTNNTAALPPGPMHLCIQLDWFPKSGASVQTTQMDVDWVRQYPVSADTTGTGSAATTEGAPDAGPAGTVTGSTRHTVDPAAVKPGLVPAAVAAP